MRVEIIGAICFGVLVGWSACHALYRQEKIFALSSLAAVICILGGGATTALIASSLFGWYAIAFFLAFFSRLLWAYFQDIGSSSAMVALPQSYFAFLSYASKFVFYDELLGKNMLAKHLPVELLVEAITKLMQDAPDVFLRALQAIVEKRAPGLIPDQRRKRYANATLFNLADGQVSDPDSSLANNDIVHLRLDIGPASAESQVTPLPGAATVAEFPSEKLPPNITLDVMVSSIDFQVSTDIHTGPYGLIANGSFFLPEDGGAATNPQGGRFLNFFLKVPERRGVAIARINYYFKNTLVQSQQLTAQISQPGGFKIVTDFTLSEDLTNLEAFPSRPRINILTNSGSNGLREVVLRGSGVQPNATGNIFTVSEQNVGKGIAQLRAALRMRAPKTQRRSKAELQEDLRQLAPRGFDLWQLVPGQDPRIFAPLIVDPSSHVIQICRPTDSGFVFPWALIYDIPLSGKEPKICELVSDWDGESPLVPAGLRQCPHGPHTENVLCPFGFWGFRYAIDQLSSTREPSFEIAVPAEWNFVVGETRYDVDLPALTEHIENLRKILQKNFPNAKIQEGLDKDAIKQLLGQDVPLVYFYCHGESGYEGDPNTYLGVGSRETIRASEFRAWIQSWLIESGEKKIVWDKIRPLVFINACHSLEIYPATLVSYLDAFVGSARAAGVIGTEVKVQQDLAMKVSERFFELLLARRLSVDEALHNIRMDYLAYGNLLGLYYTPYCWSELKFTQH